MTASPVNEAVLLIADSERDADMLYAAGMFVPDPFTFLQVGGRKTIMMSDLEIDRARAQSKVDEVVSLTDYTDRAKVGGNADPGLVDAVVELLREREVKHVSVPNGFPLGYADKLRDRGFEVASKADPFWDQRPVKTDDEVAAISDASRHTEEALRMAFGLLAEATVKDGLLHGPEGPLTSEYIRKRIHVYLLERDCIAQHTIIAGGVQGCDPHNGGSGPLRAGEPIIFDLFPKSMKTGYYADITRTVAKGPVSDTFLRLYDTVLEGQEIALSRVRAGADGRDIHGEVERLFEGRGYETGAKNGRMQGFFHGTGHGFGLEIHEPPRISKVSQVLVAGHVVTVEPGLYYPDLGGGVRIEDNVVVTESGCDNLTCLEKVFEL
ncbi:MAG: aminopeptidase P family protein [Gemmatimonadetes bacterium]|nr:aminopeptidase P family protein [Gemmatimonadota bacterium]MYG84684.1 aminopeptidase P family protein [Gemmatimonadota bacterium]MYJ88693.1 aminopeptidase P family protein [Gemmatimonadota bacterium]